jgi:hypothetical protein
MNWNWWRKDRVGKCTHPANFDGADRIGPETAGFTRRVGIGDDNPGAADTDTAGGSCPRDGRSRCGDSGRCFGVREGDGDV